MKMTIREYLDKRARDPSSIADHPCWGDGSHYDYDRQQRGQEKRQRDNFIDLYFRYLAACRDYPYAEHRPPSISGCVYFDPKVAARECELEFRRSNPGFAT